MRKKTQIGITVVAAALALFGGLNVASGSSVPGPEGPSGPDLPTIEMAAPERPAKSELLFVPTSPCRIVDTRATSPLSSSGTTRNFYVTGTAGFAPQGGKAGGCGVPARAKAVSFAVTSLDATAAGRFVAFPAGSAVPSASTMNYQKAVNQTTSATVKLGTGGKMSLNNKLATVDVAIDVAGYYIEQIAGMISPDGSVYLGTDRIVSAVHNSAGNYTVTVDTDATYCTPTVTGYSGYVYASAYAFDNKKIQVYVWYLSGGAEVAYDTYFYLTVDC